MYKLESSARFKKEFRKLDKNVQNRIRSWITENLVNIEDPRSLGKGLVANRSGQWRYRIGDYRLICLIKDQDLIILALSVGHRRNIYKRYI